jgi:hypothetical protein
MHPRILPGRWRFDTPQDRRSWLARPLPPRSRIPPVARPIAPTLARLQRRGFSVAGADQGQGAGGTCFGEPPASGTIDDAGGGSIEMFAPNRLNEYRSIIRRLTSGSS